jgi:hypothetical protein
VQQFMVLQDNAAKFQHNRGLVEKKRAALERGVAFRAPIPNQGRSFVPKYGAVRELGEVQEGAATVTDTDGNEVNFKNAQPVQQQSPEVQAAITNGKRQARPNDPGKLQHKGLAEEVAAWLRSGSGATVAQIKAKLGKRIGKDLTVVQLMRTFPTLFGSRAGKWIAKAKRAVGIQTGQFRKLTGLERTPRLPRGSVPTEVVGSSSSAAPASSSTSAPAAPTKPLRPEIEEWIAKQTPEKQKIARYLMSKRPNWALGSLQAQTGLHYTGNPKRLKV